MFLLKRANQKMIIQKVLWVRLLYSGKCMLIWNGMRNLLPGSQILVWKLYRSPPIYPLFFRLAKSLTFRDWAILQMSLTSAIFFSEMAIPTNYQIQISRG